ncbi:acetate--CoA ligase [bacterium]|nr:acetate--CoA ligase [bacterium]
MSQASQTTFFQPGKRAAASSYLDYATYEKLYRESIEAPEIFWAKQATEQISWLKPWTTVLTWDYSKAHVRWFEGAKLNVCYNCLDRHLDLRGQKIALIGEGNEPGDVQKFSYREAHKIVCQFANALKSLGVKRGDRVAIYMPMIPQAAFAMLACARIGAVHSVIFGGFSAEAIRDRVLDAECVCVITANEGLRGAKSVPLKHTVDQALEGVTSVKHVLVHRRTKTNVKMYQPRDIFLDEILEKMPDHCACEEMDAEDPLFILYTSGSTGKPKGVLHTQGGYLVYAAVTHKYVFDYHEEDIYFCAADVGWITGHTYVVYGPLANGATSLMFESLPNYPDAGRYWDTIERHRVNIFYTAPTAIRTVAKEGETKPREYDLSSLRILGTVGEPINADAWQWYYQMVGNKECSIVDTWWQTETGGILITPLPGVTPTKPGSATLPFFGIRPEIVDEQGQVLEGNNVRGRLCITFPWPGQMRTVYGDHQRFFETYFSQFPGKYFTGDASIRDKDGYYWITGRVDDVINVSGHRIGTAEVESAIVHSGIVAEAAVVGVSHPIKGSAIYAFCCLREGVVNSEAVNMEIRNAVKKVIGGFAAPDFIQIVPGLPKTRSGKIMRRILRKITEGELEQIGDTTTLADPAIVSEIIKGYKR